MRLDVTELHRAEAERLSLQAQVYRAQKMEALGRMAGGIAHDFNSLLMGIEGYAGFLRDDLPEASEQRRFAECILAATNRASDLVRQILDYGRPGCGRRQPLRLDRLVDDSLAPVRAAMPSGVSLAVESEVQAPVVDGDADQLGQVVASVAANARDALGSGPGRVRVRLGSCATGGSHAQRLTAASNARGPAMVAERSDDGLNRLWLGVLPPGRYNVIEVEDDGAGMDLAVLERMFDPFFTTKDQAEAAGLGLAAAQGIVLAHGGGFAVETRPGCGTRVRILLPAAETVRDAMPAGSPSPGLPRPPKRRAA
jgi:signal transduction histidine kinase